jgi:hypothetical protein
MLLIQQVRPIASHSLGLRGDGSVNFILLFERRVPGFAHDAT